MKINHKKWNKKQKYYYIISLHRMCTSIKEYDKEHISFVIYIEYIM